MSAPGPQIYDLVVIGGGVVGSATAMFAARAGWSTALVERTDFGAGASGASTEMIHGGLQYLAKLRPAIVRQSCIYAQRIHRSAPHLCEPLPIIVPMYRGGPYGRLSMGALLTAYEWFNRRYKHAPPKQALSAAQVTAALPRIHREGLLGGVRYFEWWVDATRLCLANALAAVEAGAWAQNHASVVAMRAAGECIDLEIDDQRAGARHALRGRVVVNATGPWTDQLAQLAGLAGPPRIRPTRGVHLLFPRMAEEGVLVHLVDNRFAILLPRGEESMLGTTDDDFYGDLDDKQVTADESAYLLQGLAHTFSGITADQVVDTKVGVRPTVHQYGVTEDRVSRDHRVEPHEGFAAGRLISVYGGKLATHTWMAEDVLRTAAARLGRSFSPSADYRLPGAPRGEPGDARAQSLALAAERGIETAVAAALWRRYGTRMHELVRMVQERPELGENLCRCPAATAGRRVLAAEVLFAQREELALSLDDVRRRTGLGVGHCRQHGCLRNATHWLTGADR